CQVEQEPAGVTGTLLGGLGSDAITRRGIGAHCDVGVIHSDNVFGRSNGEPALVGGLDDVLVEAVLHPDAEAQAVGLLSSELGSGGSVRPGHVSSSRGGG